MINFQQQAHINREENPTGCNICKNSYDVRIVQCPAPICRRFLQRAVFFYVMYIPAVAPSKWCKQLYEPCSSFYPPNDNFPYRTIYIDYFIVQSAWKYEPDGRKKVQIIWKKYWVAPWSAVVPGHKEHYWKQQPHYRQQDMVMVYDSVVYVRAMDARFHHHVAI